MQHKLESGARFTAPFLKLVEGSTSCSSKVTAALQELAQQPDTRSQVQTVSRVCKAASAALGSSSELETSHELCLRLLFEILFLPQSAHLHKSLVATLRPLVRSEDLKISSSTAIYQCVREHQRQWSAQSKEEGFTLTCIPLAAAWTSLSSCLSDIPVDISITALQLLAEQIHCCLQLSQSASAPLQASLAHDLKVGLAAVYETLQRLPSDACVQHDAKDALYTVKSFAFTVLHSDDVIKEAAVSAAGTLWGVAMLLFPVPSEIMASTFALGMFHSRLDWCTVQPEPGTNTSEGSSHGTSADTLDASSDRLVKVQLRAFEEDLKTLQPIGLARVMRALAACMPASALCARLQITPSMTAEQPASVHSHSHGDAATGMKPWSFIVDGMLAESLWMVEMSASHGAQVTYNAVAAAAACMDRMVDESDAVQQTAQISSGIGHLPSLSEQLADRVLHLILNNIHEGREGRKLTTHQAAQTFAALCTLISAQNSGAQPEVNTSGAGLDWLDTAMKQLVAQPVTQKSRYSLLNVLVPYIGASRMILERPKLVQECLQAMQADTCTVATAFLRELLSTRKTELVQQSAQAYQSSIQPQQQPQDNTVSDGWKAEWRGLWMQPVVQLLQLRDVNFRGKLVNYCLPMLLQLDPESLPDLLSLQMHSFHEATANTETQQRNVTAAIAGTVAVLSAARTMHLFDSLDAVLEDESGRQHVPYSLLAVAAVHKDESLRIQTLELSALSVKSTSAPGDKELDLVQRQLILTSRAPSSSTHNKTMSVVEKLVHRIRAATLCIQHRAMAASKQDEGPGTTNWKRKACRPTQQPVIVSRQDSSDSADQDAKAMERMHAFMQWLTQMCCDSLHPGVAHARCHFAIHCLQVVLMAYAHDRWIHAEHNGSSISNGNAESKTRTVRVQKKYRKGPEWLQDPSAGNSNNSLPPFDPLAACIRRSESFVQTVILCVVNSWLPIRKASVQVLRLLPTPLCDVLEPSSVRMMLKWAANLFHSPRPFEADAGAQILSLLHDICVLQRGWSMVMYPEPSIKEPSVVQSSAIEEEAPEAANSSEKGAAGLLESLKFILSLENGVCTAVKLAESDMVAACRHSFLQGKLLALQHAITSFPWTQVHQHGAEVVESCKLLISSLVDSLLKAADLCVPYLDGRYNVDADEVLPDDNGLLTAEAGVPGAAEAGDEKHQVAAESISESQGAAGELGPNATILVTGSWNAIKEISSTLAVLISSMAACGLMGSIDQPSETCTLLETHQITSIGNFFVSSLCVVKHNGATRKLQLAFEQILLDSVRSSEEPWPKVHAFNCLRIIFETAALIKGAAVSLEDAVRASIEGIAEQEWEVRNAATLAYVTLVARLLGLKNSESESNSRKPAMLVQAFLTSYPSLAAFLLERLKEAVAQTAASHAATPHPQLHPILLLFSNMQRSDGEAREANSTTPVLASVPFQEVIQLCLSMPSLAVRTLAARSLAVLCPAGDLPVALAQQLLAVPQHPAELKLQSADAVHGALLAVHHMLLNAVPTCHSEESSATLSAAAPLVQQRLWMIHQCLCPCAAVSREFVHVLMALNSLSTARGHMTSNDNTVQSEQAAQLTTGLELPSQAAQALMAKREHTDHHWSPMQDLWSQSMARLAFCDSSIDENISFATAVYSMRSQQYALRIEGFRWLADTDIAQFGSNVRHRLAEELWSAIDSESNQVALAAAIEAAVSVGGCVVDQEGDQVSCTPETAGSLNKGVHALNRWNSVCDCVQKRIQHVENAVAAHGKDQHISQQALRCTGALLGDLLEQHSNLSIDIKELFRNDTVCTRLMNNLIIQIESNAGPSEPPGHRTAAAFALIRSRVLLVCTTLGAIVENEPGSSSLMHLSLRGWTVAFALLEDEDDIVRRMLIDGLGRLIESLSSGVNIGDCETLFPYVHHTVAMSSETCPEAVLQHAFHILTVCCGWSHVYMLWLKDWVAGKQDVQDLQPPVQTAKRLFAREAQNGHADWYLLSQVAAESFAHCSEPPQHVLQQALDDSLALFQSALECAALLEGNTARPSSWCDEYTIMCTLRGCLLAQLALSPSLLRNNGTQVNGNSELTSKPPLPDVKMDDSRSPRMRAELLKKLQSIVTKDNHQYLQPMCQRSIQSLIDLLSSSKI